MHLSPASFTGTNKRYVLGITGAADKAAPFGMPGRVGAAALSGVQVSDSRTPAAPGR
jgi:hypothetical protein